MANWIITLAISLSTPYLFKGIDGWAWLIFLSTAVLGLVYIFIFMKETRGLSKERIKRLYYKQAEVYDPII